MRAAIGLAMVLVCVGCDEPPQPGQSCDTADQVVCGKQGGTQAALLCMPGASGNTYSYLANCQSCDHVLGCKTEVICNGVNVANNGLRCEVEGVGACDINRNALLLKCENGEWTTLSDCSTFGHEVCGKGADGNLTCIPAA